VPVCNCTSFKEVDTSLKWRQVGAGACVHNWLHGLISAAAGWEIMRVYLPVVWSLGRRAAWGTHKKNHARLQNSEHIPELGTPGH
jgi:hypothetical protein